MKRLAAVMLVGSFSCATVFAGKVEDRVVRSAVTLREIMGIPEKGIPTDLLDKCACVAIIPSMKKGGFVVGGNYGRGVISCRTENGDGPWSAPSMILLGGGSFGLQIGAEAVDVVLLIMNPGGLYSLLDSRFTLGGDASVAAGPVGRTAQAETDAYMGAQILAYSRSRGLFAGLTLKGGVLRTDKDANTVLYKKEVGPKDLLLHPAKELPKDAKILVDELTKFSPKHAK